MFFQRELGVQPDAQPPGGLLVEVEELFPDLYSLASLPLLSGDSTVRFCLCRVDCVLLHPLRLPPPV